MYFISALIICCWHFLQFSILQLQKYTRSFLMESFHMETDWIKSNLQWFIDYGLDSLDTQKQIFTNLNMLILICLVLRNVYLSNFHTSVWWSEWQEVELIIKMQRRHFEVEVNDVSLLIHCASFYVSSLVSKTWCMTALHLICVQNLMEKADLFVHRFLKFKLLPVNVMWKIKVEWVEPKMEAKTNSLLNLNNWIDIKLKLVETDLYLYRAKMNLKVFHENKLQLT